MKLKPIYQKLLITVVVCFVFAMNVNAQSPTDAFAKIDASGGQFNATFFINLPDTTTISQIEIGLGTSQNESNIISLQAFNFDVTNGLPSGYSYSRTGNIVRITTSNFNDYSTFYGTVRLKNTSGSFGTFFNFITN